ncbi:MAG: hypothetical protein IPF58_18070 [Saprospirales bacterium]|nr:hypothetical protein [Saprospirales bacterium]
MIAEIPAGLYKLNVTLCCRGQRTGSPIASKTIVNNFRLGNRYTSSMILFYHGN